MTIDRKKLRKRLVGELTLRRLIRSLLEIYLCVLVWAIFFSDRIIFQPPQPSYVEGGDVYRIPVSNEEKIAVFACANDDARYVVLHAHGNAEDIGTVRFFADEFCFKGFATYTFDYRGYGISDGKPGTRRAFEDGEALLHHLVHEEGIPLNRIIMHGRSVGAAIAVHLASRYDVAGLIVESGFLTAFRSQTRIPISPIDKMRNNRAILNVKCPVLVMHGEADRVIPAWHGKKLYELAPEPKRAYWVPNAGHDDVLAVAPDEYWKQIAAFVAVLADEPHAGAAREH